MVVLTDSYIISSMAFLHDQLTMTKSSTYL